MPKRLYKRYQYYSNEGIKWTEWFPTSNKEGGTIQFKGKTTLKNEYKEE